MFVPWKLSLKVLSQVEAYFDEILRCKQSFTPSQNLRISFHAKHETLNSYMNSIKSGATTLGESLKN